MALIGPGPEYDVVVRQRKDGMWIASLPPKRKAVVSATTLTEALQGAARVSPSGFARVRHNDGKVAVVHLRTDLVGQNATSA